MTQEENALPASVQRKQAEAEAARKAIYKAEDTPPSAPGPEETPAAADEPPTASAEPETPAEAPEGETDWKAEYERLEAKHETLQGKYSAEVPRLSKQLREANDALARTQSELQAAKAAGPATTQGTGDADVDAKLASVRDEYGEDLVETITLVARKLVNEATEERVRPLDERIKQDSEEREEAKRARFFSDLDTDVPGWKRINTDPKFHQWLAQADSLTGAERQASLNDAYSKLDARRVAAIFNLYLEQSGEQPPNTDPKDSRREDLARQVTPEGRGQGTPPPDEPKVFTKADTDRLQQEAREGRIDDATFNARMQEITKAIGEGRYRPS